MISSSREVVSGFQGAALNQSRSASGVYTGLLCWHWWGCQWSASCGRRKKAAPVRQQNMWYRIYSASSLTDSLRSVVRLRRAVPAYKWGGNFRVDARSELNRETRRPRRCRFSIGSAPWQASRNLTLKSVAAKPDRTIKIPGVSPWRLPRALSCSCLSVYRCHSAVMAAFVSFHAWHSVPGRQFAPSWTVCTNPPFSPTAAPYPVTIVLSPTRKDMQKHHWQQPLVIDLEELVLKSCAG